MGILDMIGNTPLVDLSPLSKCGGRIFAKNESKNPSGSIKDRIAKFMVEMAELTGELKPGDRIVEATSGNTGIAFSMVAKEKGYKMIVVMPKNMSEERKQRIKELGAELVLVGESDFDGAIKKAYEIASEPHTFIPRQFSNYTNTLTHITTTGREIIKQFRHIDKDGKIDAFVAGTGTGGTLMGVRVRLLREFPELKTIAVEPAESAVMSGGCPGMHKIQGIGDGFIPDLVDMQYIDEVEAIPSDEAIATAKMLKDEFGYEVGISSGANVCAAMRVSDRYETIVTILPDSGDRYASMGL
ncbi:MAG: cysteine synthase family protein [Candidatus Schekmanbacteria bacterium]|nr:MAG: cysteine synthase family protein [Candidatus Schekmanbacteria bacterium]